jgi:tetratricopeptide (TPR) repeat protein
MKAFRAFVVLAALASGCATTSYRKIELSDADFAGKPVAVVNDVPFIEQTPKLCGPTALYMAAKPLDPDLSLDELSKLAYSPAASGSFKQDLLAAARRLGLAPYRVADLRGMLDQLAQGRPVIIFHRTSFLWKNFWHYSVLTGYDRREEEFTMHIGPYAHRNAKISDVIGSWVEGGSWAYVISSPEKVPASADFQETLDNGLAFLRLGRNESALAVSESALARWPERYESDVIRAEAQMKLDRREEAIRSLKSAAKKEPGNEILKRKLAELARAGA